MQAETEGVTPDPAEQIRRQKVDDLTRETLRLGFHRR
jgi:hypothetical protein